jgi:hypothetical protein
MHGFLRVELIGEVFEVVLELFSRLLLGIFALLVLLLLVKVFNSGNRQDVYLDGKSS